MYVHYNFVVAKPLVYIIVVLKYNDNTFFFEAFQSLIDLLVGSLKPRDYEDYF